MDFASLTPRLLRWEPKQTRWEDVTAATDLKCPIDLLEH